MGPLSTVCSGIGVLSLISGMFNSFAVIRSRKFPAEPESISTGKTVRCFTCINSTSNTNGGTNGLGVHVAEKGLANEKLGVEDNGRFDGQHTSENVWLFWAGYNATDCLDG